MFEVFTRLGNWISYSLLDLSAEGRLGPAVQFFVEDVTKIFILLAVMIYIISFARAGLDTDRIRNFLTGRTRFAGYTLAAGFGAVTPFCSCSSVPLFLGFTSARIPLGITMSFLITSPMINEVAILLLGSLFGVKFTLIYLATGLAAGIIGGMFIDLIGAEKHLRPIGRKAVELAAARPESSGPAVPAAGGAGSCGCGEKANTEGSRARKGTLKARVRGRHDFARGEVGTILKRVWMWVLIGVAVGSFLHGFIPEGFISDRLGDGGWWSVPAAVLLGIPLYSGTSGIIPVAQSLLAKGLPIGTTIAFMMSVVAASLPEFTMLRQVMKPKLLAIFFAMLLVFFTAAGWLFNVAL